MRQSPDLRAGLPDLTVLRGLPEFKPYYREAIRNVEAVELSEAAG